MSFWRRVPAGNKGILKGDQVLFNNYMRRKYIWRTPVMSFLVVSMALFEIVLVELIKIFKKHGRKMSPNSLLIFLCLFVVRCTLVVYAFFYKKGVILSYWSKSSYFILKKILKALQNKACTWKALKIYIPLYPWVLNVYPPPLLFFLLDEKGSTQAIWIEKKLKMHSFEGVKNRWHSNINPIKTKCSAIMHLITWFILRVNWHNQSKYFGIEFQHNYTGILCNFERFPKYFIYLFFVHSYIVFSFSLYLVSL